MGKILVIEPGKILQQALRLALCPDHEVQLYPHLFDKGAATVKDYDLAIIDAAGLREANAAGAEVLLAAQTWEIPKIWIDDDERAQSSDRDRLVVLAKPIQKDTLQAAIATCLSAPSAGKQNGSGRQSAQGATGASGEGAGDSSTTQSPVIIDLVDVVEEPPERKNAGRQQRKTK